MLMMIDKNDFNVIAFDVETSLINKVLNDVSMLMMTEKESFDEASDVDDANLI